MTEINLHQCDEATWQAAQRVEFSVWGGENCGDGYDWADYWEDNCNGYSFLRGNHYGHVIEVACGPYAKNLRTIMPMITYEQLYVLDPLLDGYCKLGKSGVAKLLPTVGGIGMTTTLEEMTQHDMFDLLICNNAIDHCYDLELVFENMYNAIKPGGTILFGNDLKCREDMAIARDTMHPIMVEQDYLDEKFSRYEEELYKKVVGRDVVRNKTACCGAYFAAFRKAA